LSVLTNEMSDLDTEPRSSRRLWIISGLGALALHLGGAALAIAHLPTGDDEDSLGAPAIEVGIELTSPHADPIDLPPGPDLDAAVASPQLPDQKAEVKETDLPKDTPTEAEDPDRVVTPNESRQPDEDDPKVAAVQTTASPESVAQEATATPNLEGRLDERTKAPKQGIGKSAELAKVTWEKKVMAQFKKHLVFPDGAKAKGKGAKVHVVLNVEFDRLGHVISLSIAEGSGQPAYDEAALKMVRKSDPVPAPPPEVADLGLSRILPVLFNDPNK
jgi:TonB family protein